MPWDDALTCFSGLLWTRAKASAQLQQPHSRYPILYLLLNIKYSKVSAINIKYSKVSIIVYTGRCFFLVLSWNWILSWPYQIMLQQSIVNITWEMMVCLVGCLSCHSTFVGSRLLSRFPLTILDIHTCVPS